MQLIKKLREDIQAPLNIVKSAVSQASPAGDYESALSILKMEMIKRGEKLVAKSAERVATEGWVIAARSNDGLAGSLSVLNCETDFVAKSDKVVNLAQTIGEDLAFSAKAADGNEEKHLVSSQETIDNVTTQGIPLKQRLTESMSLFGESIKMNREISTRLSGSTRSYVGIHCHGGPSISENVYLGRMGAMINVSSKSVDVGKIADELAREVVAQNPESMDEFWTLEKVGDSQGRTVREWAGVDVEISAWSRLDR